ncbi:MAG TPA: DUF1573 domain-containing protein [Candidatus Krumholzibacteria bacterium]|nr:DUF1573 domain-containing protein [Candidatus Krumholzibacteria bacterium]
MRNRNLSRLTMTMLALAAGVVAGSVVPVEVRAGEPKIDIPETRHDFGRVFERKQYIHDFTVYNRGDADLVINNVRPGCGCTVTNFDKLIPAGKQGNIEFVLDGEKVHHQFSKSATVSSNDPVHPTMTIAVSGEEISYLNIEPEGTVYLHGRYGEHVERTMTVSSNEEIDFKILRLSSNIDDKITYKIEPTAETGTYDLTVYKNPKLPTLITYGTLYLHTNSKEAPKSEIQVHVITKGNITVSPAAVNFGPVKFAEQAGAGQTVTRGVILSKAAGEFNIKDITFSNPNFTASVEPVAEGKQYRVQVTFTPPLKKLAQQNETAEMIIHTTDAEEPAIRVTVAARSM